MTVGYYPSPAHSFNTDTYSLASISVNSCTTTTTGNSTDSSMAVVPSTSSSLDSDFPLFGDAHHNVPALCRQTSSYSNASSAVSLGCSSSTSCGGSSMCCSSCDSVQSATDVFSPSETHIFPPLPLSEDEDEDWREFGYLLENCGDELPLFTDDELMDDIVDEKSKHHHHCHHHKPPEKGDSNASVLALSPPSSESLVDVNNNDPHMSVDDQCDTSSLTVEAPSLVADEHVALATNKRESVGKNESLSTDLLELHNNQCADNQCWWWSRFFYAPYSTNSKQENSDAAKKQGEDEPVAKRTRNGLIFKSCRDETQKSGQFAVNSENTSAACVPSTSNRIVAVAPRPWWFHKLRSMRQQQSSTNRCREHKRSTASKRQDYDNIEAMRLVQRNRRRNGKATKKAKKELENALELCDPRFITLGSTNVQTDLPLKLELDMSGNAKITTASKWLTDEKNDGGGSRRGRNDNTDDDQSDETDQELLKENTVAPANAKRKAAVNVRPSLASIGRRRAKSAATRAIERRRQQRERSRQTQVKREKQQQKRAASTSNSEGEEDDEMMEEEEENTEQILRASSSCAHHNNGDEETTYIGGKSNIAASMSAVSCGSGGKSSARRNGAGWSHRKNRNQSQRAAQRRHQQAAALLAHNPAPALLKPPRVLSSAERFDTTKTEEDGGGSAASATTTAFSASNADGVSKYCPCGSSYDPKKFYISCDECKHWYHGKCVNVTEKKAQKLAEEAQVASGNAAAAVADGRTPSGWICAECERERSKESAELYCVCRRPYNDKQFYVGCDSCEDWFHPECIGTTQAEVEKCDSFLCPKCRETVPGADEEMF